MPINNLPYGLNVVFSYSQYVAKSSQLLIDGFYDGYSGGIEQLSRNERLHRKWDIF